MKLNNLKKALEHYVLSADCPADERQDVLDAIAECNEVAERFDSHDIWKDAVYIVTSDALSDLLNIVTYDIYGKRAKLHGEKFPFSYYTHDVRCNVNTELTNRALELGYDIIADLWHDNEADGCHNPDGTFSKQ